MSKNLDSWNTLKKELNVLSTPPLFKEREIWWTSIGLNIGFEIFGKNESYTRPVLILKKYSRFTFLGLPLTSKQKNIPSHLPLEFKNEKGAILLDQGRTFDSRRLHKLMGYIGKKRFQRIGTAFINYNIPQ